MEMNLEYGVLNLENVSSFYIPMTSLLGAQYLRSVCRIGGGDEPHLWNSHAPRRTMALVLLRVVRRQSSSIIAPTHSELTVLTLREYNVVKRRLSWGYAVHG